MKRTSFTKRIFSGFGMLLMSDFMCLILAMITLKFFKYTVVSLIIGVFCIAILGLTFFSYGYNLGEEDKKYAKRKIVIDVNMSKKLGAIAMIPLLLLLGCLIISKIGLIGNFLPIYKLTNAFFLPFIQMFSSGTDMSIFPIYGFIVLFVLIFAIPVAIYFGYDLGYKEVDLTLKIFYKKKS